jgi:hypothetical protein
VVPVVLPLLVSLVVLPEPPVPAFGSLVVLLPEPPMVSEPMEPEPVESEPMVLPEPPVPGLFGSVLLPGGELVVGSALVPEAPEASLPLLPEPPVPGGVVVVPVPVPVPVSVPVPVVVPVLPVSAPVPVFVPLPVAPVFVEEPDSDLWAQAGITAMAPPRTPTSTSRFMSLVVIEFISSGKRMSSRLGMARGRDNVPGPVLAASSGGRAGGRAPGTHAARGPCGKPGAGYPRCTLCNSRRKSFCAAATVCAGPVSLKKTGPSGPPSTMAPSSRQPGLGVEGPIIVPLA